ncbi:tail fiber assembly protein [Salinicola sp. V024]|uniref:tail fiber assembly protein n=1 Tax=Salinicola sp. V024 TaxID=3459609 RepID=UPI0040450626
MKINYDNRTYYAGSREQFEAQGLPDAIIDAAIADQQWAEIRARRDALLRASDYAVMPDYPLTDEQLAAVKQYRQALRDIPETADAPDAIEWPEKPEVLS